MPILLTVCGSISWRAVGDADKIRELLADVASIGKKRAAGEGQVLRWEVQDAPFLDVFSAGHLHPDGSLGRPVPPTCLEGRNSVRHSGTGLAGLRPPYIHPDRQHQLTLPMFI